MNRFVFVALLLMAWAYWELSGGAGFTPETRAGAESGVVVTRADTSAIETPAPVEPLARNMSSEETAITETAAVADAAQEESEIAGLIEEIESGLSEPAFAENPLTATTTDADTTAQPRATIEPGLADLRVVTGSRVNLRDGPGTSYGAIDQLASGTILEVIETNNGWAHIEVQGTEQSGWMSADFLTPLNG